MVRWTSCNKLSFVLAALRQFDFQIPRLDCNVPAEGGNCFLVWESTLQIYYSEGIHPESRSIDILIEASDFSKAFLNSR